MDIPDEPLATVGPPPTVRVSRRGLVVLAGLPGAGKSTLLAKLQAPEDVSVLDSEQVRAKMRSLLPDRFPYRWYRLVVHLAHRLRIGYRCAVTSTPVLAHEPSTRPTTRAMLVLFGWATGRKLTLLWLHVDAAEALAGQHARGRLIRSRSFYRHVFRAKRLHRLLRAGRTPRGWDSVHLFRRHDVEHGLRLEIGG